MYMKKRKNQTVWKDFEIGFRYQFLVKIESCFLCGYLYKERQASINDLDIAIEQKTFL